MPHHQHPRHALVQCAMLNPMGAARAAAIRSGLVALLVAVCLLGLAAQSAITAADIHRLHDEIFEAGTDLARLRTGDTILLGELRIVLDDARDDVAAMAEKVRDGRDVPASDYEVLRSRIEDVRRRARSELTANGAGVGPSMVAPLPSEVSPRQLDLPPRTRLRIRLLARVEPQNAVLGDRIEASIPAKLVVRNRVVVPAGSLIRGIVIDVRSSGRGKRTLTVRFDYLTVDYHAHPINVLHEIDRPYQAGADLHLRFN